MLCNFCRCAMALFLLSSVHGFAQGTLSDYQRARRFLPGNLRHSIYVADVSAHWLDKTNRFWYHKVSPKGTEFILVDASRNTVAPAFDHEKLASALARFTKHEYSATDLPFDTIEFTDDQKAIRFQIEKSQWTCTLSDYECNPGSGEDSDETLSPDKKWKAVVKDHNLYVRNVSTGTIIQLTVLVARFQQADHLSLRLPELRPVYKHSIRSPGTAQAEGLQRRLSLAGRGARQIRAHHFRHSIGKAD